MRTPRQHKVDLAVMTALSQIGSFLLPQTLLVAEAQRLVVPKPTVAEIDAATAYHEAERRIVGVQGETEAKYKLTDNGRAWLAEHA